MAKALVEEQIKNNKVMVFSKSYCPFCTMAKDALKAAGLKEFGLMEIENRGDEAAIQDALLAKTGGRTVPRVFIGGKFVGGGSEVKELQDSNQLVPLLQAAGAL
ncbi:uncharacterized protein [Dysidea avara]|uniref:uncharacterized protein n=1 Tax=Dysidea avara TaxID=196820 RepID=UPI0033314152